MAHSIIKAFVVGSLLLVSSIPVLADPHPHKQHVARQNSASCVPNSLLGQVGPGNGGRKIGMVIDVSLSMSDNDPDDVRLVAAAAINDVLISTSEAIDGKTADLVTVVEFDNSANVRYPLDDPAGAGAIIAGLTLGSGTFIASGIQAGIDELTKPGSDPTANRTGIVVFTDGQDNSPELSVEEINRAAGLGIRVSFGFLSIDSSNQQRDILAAILSTGGTYATIDSATAQQTFVALVLANGLTATDAQGTNASSTLLPGLATATFFSQTAPNTFTYAAQAGETFNITTTAIDPIDLEVTLRDATTATDINSTTTDTSGIAFLEYTAPSDMAVELIITSSNSSATGIFSVGLRSSIAFAGANCTIESNTTSTANYTPTASPPAQFTGEAAFTSARCSTALFSLLVLAVAAMVL